MSTNRTTALKGHSPDIFLTYAQATGVFTIFMPVATAPVNAAGDIPKDIAEALAGAAGTAALEARQDTNPPVTCVPLPIGIVCL